MHSMLSLFGNEFVACYEISLQKLIASFAFPNLQINNFHIQMVRMMVNLEVCNDKCTHGISYG